MLDKQNRILYHCISQVIQLEKIMPFSFNNQTPIYFQIIEYIKTEIITGRYKSGEKIPSVREFSAMFEVNPNTVQKALLELEDINLIVTERTSGKFVTQDKEIIEKIKKQTVDSLILEFYKNMGALGIDKEKALKILNED